MRMKKLITNTSHIRGTVKISGSKNASLPIIVAALLSNKRVILKNVPNISDVMALLSIYAKLKIKYHYKKNYLVIYPQFNYNELVFDEVKSFRASYYLMGLFLGKFKRVKIFTPGGCKIGSRPIDFHLEGFKLAGCKVIDTGKVIEISAESLKPFCYSLPKKSLGASINLTLLALNIKGTTVIRNVSTEPELEDFIGFVNKLGYHIVKHQDELIIEGKLLKEKKIKYHVMPDRIEAFTFISLGIYSEHLKIKKINLNHLTVPLKTLIRAGLNYRLLKNGIIIYRSKLKPLHFTSGDYPLISTDEMPLLYPIAMRIKGDNYFKETIFEKRFMVCNELSKTGGKLYYNNDLLVIKGYELLRGAAFYPMDLRAAASLLIEAIINGNSTLYNLNQLERGYANIYAKLKKIGVNFRIE